MLQVNEDLQLLGVDYMNFDNIKHMKKEAFKSLIDRKIKEVAMKELENEKEKRSKVKNIQYKELKTQEYLTSKIINIRRKKLIFKMRTRMIDTPENIGKNILCKLCGIEFDTQTHITECIILRLKCPELLEINSSMDHIIHRGTIEELESFSRIYEQALRLKKRINENSM